VGNRQAKIGKWLAIKDLPNPEQPQDAEAEELPM